MLLPKHAVNYLLLRFYNAVIMGWSEAFFGSGSLYISCCAKGVA